MSVVVGLKNLLGRFFNDIYIHTSFAYIIRKAVLGCAIQHKIVLLDQQVHIVYYLESFSALLRIHENFTNNEHHQ